VAGFFILSDNIRLAAGALHFVVRSESLRTTAYSLRTKVSRPLWPESRPLWHVGFFSKRAFRDLSRSLLCAGDNFVLLLLGLPMLLSLEDGDLGSIQLAKAGA
jgi:hypothetical protein